MWTGTMGSNARSSGGAGQLTDNDRIQVAFQTRMGEELVRMTSTLVETVSINYEDFNESFLTCGTCLCTYNGSLNIPKLLPCSHTVCLHCLGRIAALAGPPPNTPPLTVASTSSGAPAPRETQQTFRCPICRELIHVPCGGVSALPPSFLVNQLLDLMASQRREVIPKCSTHSNQELLFCETCDSVFCAACVTSPHVSSLSSGDHTVIPFSIAIKRMSEILLYKANECLAKLDEAKDSVGEEVRKLTVAVEAAETVANKAFEEAVQVLEKRRTTCLSAIRHIATVKQEALGEQLSLIEREKSKVRGACEGLEYQVEVRHITKGISELASQLDSFVSLRHPRENAFLVCKTESDLKSLENAVSTGICISSTFPPHSTIQLAPSAPLTRGIEVELILEARDYKNEVRDEGGDPITVTVVPPSKANLALAQGNIRDRQDGTYSIRFTPSEVGTYEVQAEIFGRSIKNPSLGLDISEHNNPVKTWGKGELCQPVSVTKGQAGEFYVLDTGNARIVVLDANLGFKRVIKNEALEGRSCTGITYCVQSLNLLVVNWRSKEVTRLNPKDGSTVGCFTSTEFVEPVGISVDPKGNTYVADNGARAVFVFDPNGLPKEAIRRDSFGLLGGVAVDRDGRTVVVADMSLLILGEGGDRELKVTGKGRFGGLVVDDEGYIIATRTEKSRSFVHIFRENNLCSTIDSFSSKLKRPSDLVLAGPGTVLVVDLGNDCLKQYRYK